MQYVGYAEMASAVSNAGALGMLTALTQPTPDALRAEIRRCRTMTKYPFGVNLTFLPAIVPPPYEEYAKAIIEEGVKVVETAGNNRKLIIFILFSLLTYKKKAGKYIKMFKAAGVTVLHKCTAIRHAISAHRLGVDVISMDGFECAGHPGEDDITAVILLAKAAKKLNLPYIASGGFADGRGLAAALALGAEGVNMGTRFMCTTEAPIHHNIKEAIVKADERSTALVFRPFRNTTRIFKNSVAVEVNKREENPEVVFEDVQELVSGARGKQVYTTGDPEFGVWTVGQVIGLIDDIPTCQDLVTRIVNDAESLIKERLNKMIVSESKL
jgi:nitronate monooxygenase